jgi:hypothetical protein
MNQRRTARWQQSVDDRILELLSDESWSTPSMMAIEPNIHATENQIRERCKVMADAGLVAIEPNDGWMVQLTTEGQLYLDGELDVELYPRPRSPRQLNDS